MGAYYGTLGVRVCAGAHCPVYSLYEDLVCTTDEATWLTLVLVDSVVSCRR